jgi:hypothetical protein
MTEIRTAAFVTGLRDPEIIPDRRGEPGELLLRTR